MRTRSQWIEKSHAKHSGGSFGPAHDIAYEIQLYLETAGVRANTGYVLRIIHDCDNCRMRGPDVSTDPLRKSRLESLLQHFRAQHPHFILIAVRKSTTEDDFERHNLFNSCTVEVLSPAHIRLSCVIQTIQ